MKMSDTPPPLFFKNNPAYFTNPSILMGRKFESHVPAPFPFFLIEKLLLHFLCKKQIILAV